MFKVVNGKQVGFIGENKLYIGRNSYGQKGSVLQNKFKVGKDGSRSNVVEACHGDVVKNCVEWMISQGIV